ncbi:MAG: phage holin family protein [Luteimonas sp.]
MAEAGEERVHAQGIDDAVREVGAAGRATLNAGRDAGKAFRILLAADISLARSAFGRTLALTGVAIAFGASAWLLLMATLVFWLNRGLGMSFSVSLLLTALLSVAGTALAAWAATRYFEHTRLKTTRRQLARLGIGELAGMMPDPGSSVPTEAAADAVTAATEGEPVKKGLGIDVTPP